MARSKCQYCGEPFPPDHGVNRKFCNAKCRMAHRRRMAKKELEYRNHQSEVAQLPEHIETMIRLAFGAESIDVMREVFREEIRDSITRAVHDNVLGAAEVMTHMLPRVLEGLANDISSEDWVVRSRAQALILKYAMSFAEKETDKNDLGTLTVVHNVPLPDTKLGEQIAEIAAAREGEILEEFEKDYPVCANCQQRKHPDTMVQNGRVQWCRTCVAYRDAATRKIDEAQNNISGLFT